MGKLNTNLNTIVKDNKEFVVLRLEGDLTLNFIEEIKEKLNPLVEQKKAIRIEVRNVDGFDLSAIQLFYALKKTALHDQFPLEFDIELTDELAQIIKNAGFDNLNDIKIN